MVLYFSRSENLGSLLNVHLKILGECEKVPRYPQHRILGKSTLLTGSVVMVWTLRVLSKQ